MIQNIKIIFKSIFKIILWITISVILLLLCLGLIIRIPAVQRSVLNKTRDYLQQKTHAEIQIKKVALTFPTSLSIESILVKDLDRDTLLCAGEIVVRPNMWKLLKHEIEINSVSLSDAYVRLARSEKDSTFNFNFLITAFSDTSAKKIDTLPPTNKKMKLTVNQVAMKNIRFTYDDGFTGIYTAHSFSYLHLYIKDLDIDHQNYLADELFLSGLKGNLEIRKHSTSKSAGRPLKLPFISANKISLYNCSFSFADKIVKQSVITSISKLELSNSSINLNTETIKAGNLFIGQSRVLVNLTQQAKEHPKSIPNEIKKGVEKGWNISANTIIFENNSLGYNILNAPQKQNQFDHNHINYEKVSLNAIKLFYSENNMYATVRKFSALDPKYFQVREFSTEFLMTKKTIRAKNMHVKTNLSEFDGDASISFTSLETIGDSISRLSVNAKIIKADIYPKEIMYFSPQLGRIPFFANAEQTHASGAISGTIGKLKVKALVVKTGSTIIQTEAVINGLPEIKRAFFDVPKIVVKTNRIDLTNLIGSAHLPDNIRLPDNLDLSGSFKGYFNEFNTFLHLQSSYGNVALEGSIDKAENFKGTIVSQHFDLGSLLNNKNTFGPVTLTAAINGHGLDTQTVKANVDLTASQLYLRNYTYHNIKLSGVFSKKIIEGQMNVNDTNIVLNLKTSINLNKGAEHYKVDMKLDGADLKKLNLTEQDLKVGWTGVCDLRGHDVNSINGTAGITSIVIASKGKKYILDSLIFAAINEEGNSTMSLSSAIIGVKYKGTFAPGDLVKELKQNVNSYFPLSNIDTTIKKTGMPQEFSFEVALHNHPIISEVFLPDLKEFEPGVIKGSYRSDKKELQLNLSIDRLLYKNYDLNSIAFETNSNENKLTYKLTSKKISTTRFKFDNVQIDGKLEDATALTHIVSAEENGNKKLALTTIIKPFNNNYKLTIDPSEFFVMNEQWNVSPDNYLVFRKEGFWFHNLSLTKASNEIFINTPSETFAGETKAGLKNFKLDDFSHIIERDTGLVKGTVNGTFNFKKTGKTLGFESDLSITALNLHDIPVGDLFLKADNKGVDKYNLDLKLTGAGNNVNAFGSYGTAGKEQSLNLELQLNPLTAQTLEAFSFGKVRDASGNLSGNFKVKGNITAPDITGSLLFNEVTLTPSFLNSSLFFKSETIKFQPGALSFDNFTVLDKNQNPAVVNGHVLSNHFSDFKFDLTATTTNFLLLNTTAKDNEEYFGTMIIDSRLRIRGTPDYPVINSSVKLKNGSYFTFAVTEKKLTTDRGEDVVLFVDSMKFNPILTRNENREKKKSSLKDFDISSSIEIDRKASIRILIDPGTNDSLVVRGDAALSFALDPSGKVSLTGVYNLTEGSYVVSLENVIHKKFKIQPGSTITWNGDPLDAIININATYYIRTSPVDLVAGQVTGAELSNYRQRYPFLILLKLRGQLLTPDIAFELQLQQSDKGAAGGTINARLEQLNDNPSSLNKQVFALLVLNRFVQENPLQTETNAGENAARTTVGKMISAQLNQLSAKFVPGVDINFDVESYDDYSSGKSQGRTQVGVGVSKQLFDERLNVQVGGLVDVEGEKAKQNNATDITGDVILEYKLTKDGRYRLKGFRNNQYQGALEGQVIQTGAGIIYVRDFNEWIQLLTKEKKNITPGYYYDINGTDIVK